MRAEKTMAPDDYDNFDVYVFGGILGDHPPKDRSRELRELNFSIRKMGDI
jgi:ribosome biogenesis SPOUT family RNA methylase Rps3